MPHNTKKKKTKQNRGAWWIYMQTATNSIKGNHIRIISRNFTLFLLCKTCPKSICMCISSLLIEETRFLKHKSIMYVRTIKLTTTEMIFQWIICCFHTLALNVSSKLTTFSMFGSRVEIRLIVRFVTVLLASYNASFNDSMPEQKVCQNNNRNGF